MGDDGFGYAYASAQLHRSQNPLRRFVKGFYLRSLLGHVSGPTIDYGCGAGQLLRLLPEGSLGLEINPHLVEALRVAGLNVRLWQPVLEAFDLRGLDDRGYRTLVLSHVLEHLPDPTAALTRLLTACRRIGVNRVVVVVPGQKGYESDTTHRTFVDSKFIEKNGWGKIAGFRLAHRRFFPLPWERGGDVYIYNEMQLLFELV